MRRLPYLSSLCYCAGVLAACAGSDAERAADTGATQVATQVAAPAGTATLSLSDVAGRWNVRAVPETGRDTTPSTYVLTATADTTGWTIAHPDRPRPIPTRVLASAGDSIVTEAGPFESVRREGVQVTTRTVWRRQGDRLVGASVARYQTTGADSVLRIRAEATRAP
jgi:hypothetical protein